MTETEQELITLVRTHEDPAEALLIATLVIVGFLRDNPSIPLDIKKQD